MQTIKTAVVVVLLLFVLYGGYVALNGTDAPISEELQNLVSVGETSADVSTPPPFQPSAVASGGETEDPFKKFASLPAPNFSGPKTNIATPQTTPPPSPLPTPPSAPAIPEIPEIDLPQLDNPGTDRALAPPPPIGDDASSAALDRRVNAQGASAKVDAAGNADPGFGLALPGGKNAGSALLPKTAPNGPALDLPTVHGNAQTLAEATVPHGDPSRMDPSMPSSKPGRSFENAKQLALEQINDGDLKKALATLSLFYNAAELTTPQRADLVDMLDALASEVVFSRNHLLDFPFVVAAGDSWEQIANQYDVPIEILARINGMDPAQAPPPGTNLKVIPGPFRAEVDLTRNELTVFVGDLYAGRYPVAFGREPQPVPGVYQVQRKSFDRNYYGSNGASIAANDPSNPYGGLWIDLGDTLCIHGSPKIEGGPSQLGCISLSPLDAGDVFGMLGVGSQVTIR